MRFFLWGLLFFSLWATFARYYYVCNIKSLCGERKEQTTDGQANDTSSLSLRYNNEILINGFEHFVFAKDSFSLQLSSDNKIFLDSISAIMAKDSNLSLYIHGYYRPSESHIASEEFENLGVARAMAVRDYLINNGLEERIIYLDYGLSDDEQLPQPLKFTLVSLDQNQLPQQQ